LTSQPAGFAVPAHEKHATYFPCGLNWARIGGVPIAGTFV
jgi:hypothetical protein